MMDAAEAKEKFLAALATCDGLVYNACRLTGLNPKIHEKWLATDPEYEQKYRRLLEGVADFVEGAMFKKIRAGDWNAIKFYLTSKCSHRGYTTDPTTINNTLNINGKPVKSLSELLGSLPMGGIETKPVPAALLPEKVEVINGSEEHHGEGTRIAETAEEGDLGVCKGLEVPDPNEEERDL